MPNLPRLHSPAQPRTCFALPSHPPPTNSRLGTSIINPHPPPLKPAPIPSPPLPPPPTPLLNPYTNISALLRDELSALFFLSSPLDAHLVANIPNSGP